MAQHKNNQKRTMTTTATAAAVEAEHNSSPPPPPPPPPPSSSSSLRATTTRSSSIMSCRPSKMSVIVIVIGFVLLLPVVYVGQTAISRKKNRDDDSVALFSFGIVQKPAEDPPGILPLDLLLLNGYSAGGVYTPGDFQNAAGIAPTFWNCSTDGNCDSNQIWGPCYAPHGHVHWKQEVEQHQHEMAAAAAAATAASSSSAAMPPIHFYNHDEQQRNSGSGIWNSHSQQSSPSDPNDLANTCRPGFLIIGAGKCGTSSLYHYLVRHPRVLPAREKQIHYFKYYYMRHPLKWYYSYFANTVSYLSSGALMTGEASPGYLPYPDVPNRIRETMGAGGGATPRIIVIGRNPLERAYSSYKYNYVSPNIDAMKLGRVKGIDGNTRITKNSKSTIGKHNTTYYEQFVFSFEDMMRAELTVLRQCLHPQHGAAIVQARETWGSQPWATAEYIRRSNEGLGPMADLDGFCYGDGDEVVNSTSPRLQWTELMAKNPTKIIINKDLHLVQSLLGRSIYTLPLEWWYAAFDKQDIYFMCTEELRDLSGAPLNALGSFLGLPSSFNFSIAVGEGAFNVAGHKGYDKEVSWDEIDREEAAHNKQSITTSGGGDGSEDNQQDDESSSPIPLSPEFRQDLEDFLRPYNERLYALTGKRCNW